MKDGGNHIIIVHVFQKKTQKTPNQVSELANERMKEVIRRLK
ncbi:type II toxin-antitoxin system RelE/ParE family toxin [Morganella morganii]|nr:type II toxin-antitoxin system RelE/ParE family toxin [Morganella morganii]